MINENLSILLNAGIEKKHTGNIRYEKVTNK